jgi:hypothetical protein
VCHGMHWELVLGSDQPAGYFAEKLRLRLYDLKINRMAANPPAYEHGENDGQPPGPQNDPRLRRSTRHPYPNRRRDEESSDDGWSKPPRAVLASSRNPRRGEEKKKSSITSSSHRLQT